MRYHRVRLHANDDPHYRAYLATIMASKANHRAMHVASNRALFGNESEGIIRQWLQDFHPLSNRRFVEYDERTGKRLTRKYREIDAVFEYDDTHIHVFEMKATSQARSIMRGMRQLNETRNILAQLFPAIYATLILVDTGIMTDDDATMLMQQADAPTNAPYTIERFYADNPHIPWYDSHDYVPTRTDELAIVRFPLADIIRGAEAAGVTLHLDWTDDEDDPEPVTPTTHTSGRHADDDNPFAAALRKAGLSS